MARNDHPRACVPCTSMAPCKSWTASILSITRFALRLYASAFSLLRNALRNRIASNRSKPVQHFIWNLVSGRKARTSFHFMTRAGRPDMLHVAGRKSGSRSV